jgi:hypothetical protein
LLHNAQCTRQLRLKFQLTTTTTTATVLAYISTRVLHTPYKKTIMGISDEPIYEEHDHLESDDIEELLPTPMTDLNSTVPSLELSTELTSEIPMSEESIVKDLEEHNASDVVELEHKKLSDVDGNDKSIEIWEPDQNDVLTGRGANVNLHPGNQKFRALCYAHKAIFDVANHAAKKRIATEIWTTCQTLYNSRFLSKQGSNINGPWIQQNAQKAILKAAQTIRDYQRPDRILHRASSQRRKSINNSEESNHDDSNGIRKRRIVKSATPMDHVVIPQPPQEPLYENPDGVETNDVLCGRGAVRVIARLAIRHCSRFHMNGRCSNTRVVPLHYFL